MAARKQTGEYEVGYGKPPKHAQFKKGQSGNPKGRPKGHRNVRTEIVAMLDAEVRIKIDGQYQVVPTYVAALMRLREKALRGDRHALDLLLRYAQERDDYQEAADQTKTTDPIDTEIIKRALDRLARESGDE